MHRVGVIGAGRWSRTAHLPAWRRDPRCRVMGVYDSDGSVGAGLDQSLRVGSASELIDSPDIDIIDVVTWNPSHYEYAAAAIAAGKHVLCEKPVHHDYRRTKALSDLARSRGLRTKVGFTFRFSPAMMRMKQLIDEGFIGRPLVFNGFEQNSQFLDPGTPMRLGETTTTEDGQLRAASLEGYGAPIIDLGLWFVGDDLAEVVGLLTNQVFERVVPGHDHPVPVPLDDADCFIGRFRAGAMATVQSSYVTVGNYPGLEARLYGTEGALICRLVEEKGVCERLWGATKASVEFEPLPIPEELFPAGGSLQEPWPTSFYSNLVSDFLDDIEAPERVGGGTFADAARVQEVIDAVELSHRQHAWVTLPLAAAQDISGLDSES
ncbi:MAG: Gfo/Idh/MocA family oxidoreductase [Candidatus Dormibacteraeota bacterium]|nr:Gfo/Idh/MocA family oxidoreductase [Candidatus Dormibacteraeota bacterium]